jgi:hypothetical protein
VVQPWLKLKWAKVLQVESIINILNVKQERTFLAQEIPHPSPTGCRRCIGMRRRCPLSSVNDLW